MASMTAEGGQRVEGIRVTHLVVTSQTTLSGVLSGAIRLMFFRDDDHQKKEKQQEGPGIFHGPGRETMRKTVMAVVISAQNL
jgi:hypothetical protein